MLNTPRLAPAHALCCRRKISQLQYARVSRPASRWYLHSCVRHSPAAAGAAAPDLALPCRYVKRRARQGFLEAQSSSDATFVQQLWEHAKQELAVVKRQAVVYSMYARKHKSVMVGTTRAAKSRVLIVGASVVYLNCCSWWLHLPCRTCRRRLQQLGDRLAALLACICKWFGNTHAVARHII